MIKRLIPRLFQRLGYQILRSPEEIFKRGPEWNDAFASIYNACKPYTMTAPYRMLAMHKASLYVAQNRIPGAVVECGVWRGGSMMVAALSLLAAGDLRPELHLFDTFEGMSEPTARDVDGKGRPVAERLAKIPKTGESLWCVASLEDVKANIGGTGYPPERIHYVKGRVEETLPAGAPPAISLLRIDVDWYEPTLHCLQTLYPRLTAGGVLILDDYTDWPGARQAIEEYFAGVSPAPLLVAVDNSARLAVKQGR
jgi:hypothetical protein